MKTALIVDDEPMIRAQVREVVENYGFSNIIEADNGAEAITLARLHSPLLIVMDVSMPVLDGITAAEKIGKERPVPIVLLTAMADATTIERARLAGVMNFIVKPFRGEQLFPAIDLAIHQFVEVSTLREEVASLTDTLETRKLVQQAKNALMRQGLSEPAAHKKLQQIAMSKRKTLRQVAEAILLADGD
jgi:response regulator NasT